MKTIIANIGNLSSKSNRYMELLIKLVKDKNLALHFIHHFNSPKQTLRPTAITGVGIASPEVFLENEERIDREKRLKQLIEDSKPDYRYINYSVGHGDLIDKIENEAIDKNVLLCAIQKTSQYNWLNEIFGTEEIDLGKKTELPCLYIPYNYEYRKPKRMLVFIEEFDEGSVVKLNEVIKSLNLDLKIIANELIEDSDIDKIKAMMVPEKDTITSYSSLNDVSYNLNKIEELVATTQTDWLCFMNYNKSFFERIYNLNTNKLLLKSELPTLIV